MKKENKMRCRGWQLALILSVSMLGHGLVAAQEEESTRSQPKDLTPYAREKEPDEDRFTKPVNPQILLVDTVVSNTDPTLTLTDIFNDGETSIAVNPRNPDEIVITAFSGGWGSLISVAVGDFNGDGKPDLAVGNTGSNNVSVLLGNGDGTFQAARNFGTGGTPVSVAVGDFNGDGIKDLAVANANSNNVSVLLGNGDGTFQAARNFGTGSNSLSVAVGDFNGDGELDLAVANIRSNNVSVLLGNGDGTFQAAMNFAVGTTPASVAVGDFNGDGILDLAVANIGSNNVSVLLGNGNGTFQPAMNFGAGDTPVSVAVGDFKGDGILDLAVANPSSNNVSVLLGNGDGTFQAAMNIDAGSTPVSLAVGDFNGDRKLDLAVANFTVANFNSGTVSVLLGNGNGTFQPAMNFGAGSGPRSVAVGDFNGDDKPDLAVANFNSGSVSVLLGRGDGTFQAAMNFDARPNAPLWHSTDGGLTWTKEFTITPPPGRLTDGCPCDQTVDYGERTPLFGTFWAGPLTPTIGEIFTGATTDPTSDAAWNWFAPDGVTQATNFNALLRPDQPQLYVNRAAPEDGDRGRKNRENIYVAYYSRTLTDLHVRVAVAPAENPPNFIVDNRVGFATGFVHPGHRLAVDRNTGFVYSLFERCVANCRETTKSIDYILNRSTDNGATWGFGDTGIVVANAESTQGIGAPKFGTVNALPGGLLHGAVDPKTGDVYYVYGSRDAATGNNRLATRRIMDDGAGGVIIGAESFVTGQVQADLPAVAVASNGTVGVFHYTFDGFSSGGFPIFSAHLAVSDDQGLTFTDNLLLTFLSSAKDNGDPSQEVLGDYMQMKTIPEHREDHACAAIFYGAFTANGVPFGRPFANHDPIFFRASLPKGNGKGCSEALER